MEEFELVLISSPDVDKQPLISLIKKVIKGNGGAITSFDDWGKRKLAYPIKKFLFGDYTQICFRAETKPNEIRTIDELNKLLTEDELALKHIIVKKD